MAPDEDHAFSALEVEQVRAIVEGWFRSESDWTVRNVTPRSTQPDVIDISVENEVDQRLVDLVLPHLEFEDENPANSSRLTDTVYNISIRFMEFMDIRGLDEFENGAITTLEIYPKDRRQPTVTEPIAKGNWVAKAPLRREDS